MTGIDLSSWVICPKELSATEPRRKTAYTVYFNRRYQLVGHLFQGRFRSTVIEADKYLLEVSRYLHLLSQAQVKDYWSQKAEPPKEYGWKRQWSAPHGTAEIRRSRRGTWPELQRVVSLVWVADFMKGTPWRGPRGGTVRNCHESCSKFRQFIFRQRKVRTWSDGEPVERSKIPDMAGNF